MCGGSIDGRGRCTRCAAIVREDLWTGSKEIHVHGSDHTEVESVTRSLTASKHHSDLLALVTRGSFWFGALVSFLGVVLVVVGATGDTSFSFFGQSFRSGNVGIAALFLGAVLVVLNIRRVLKSSDSQESK
jgi:hypothetical protein